LLLDEWEEYLELPECEQASGTVDDRRRAVVEKYHRKGGLAPWQIEAVAAALGFIIRVNVILPTIACVAACHHCTRHATGGFCRLMSSTSAVVGLRVSITS
jgi:uncharacterized protein YmfQ (DUF2313 family)